MQHGGDVVVVTFEVGVSEGPRALHLMRQRPGTTRDGRSEIVTGQHRRKRIACKLFSTKDSPGGELLRIVAFSDGPAA